MRIPDGVSLGLLLVVVALPHVCQAQPAPVPPATIVRGAEGQVTVRATRLTELTGPLTLDGRLEEDVYTAVPAFGDFIQQEPRTDEPATDKTDMWVFFDDKNVYVSARFWTEHPEDIVSNELRRDNDNVFRSGDNVGIVIDTFLDRRSGYYLNTNPQGAVRDAFITDEGRNVNRDFNLAWDVRSRRFEQGWTIEIAVPFKSLRYPRPGEQVWGFSVQRVDRKKNEFSYLKAMPAAFGPGAIWRMSAAATLVGIVAPGGGGKIELRPYALAGVASDAGASPAVSNDVSRSLGIDAKYKITKGLNADFTYNTDFAQVEADTQQINLGRFSLFFPDKRDFFVEGQTTFLFGGPASGSTLTPILFFSRRVGLTENGMPVPIQAGGRLMGRAGAYTLGVMTIQTKESQASLTPATTFSVVRIRRDILRRSAVGALATARSPSLGGIGSNQVLGVDASFALFQNIEANTYYALSRTSGVAGDQESYRGQLRFAGDRYGAEIDHTKVGGAFRPEIGFLSRPDYVRDYGFLRFSPRPKRLRAVRKFSWESALENIAGSASGRLQTRRAIGTFRTFVSNGDEIDLSYTWTDDRPLTPFTVAGARIPAGSYQFAETRLNYVLGPQRQVVGTAAISRGSYYGGEKTEISYSGKASMTSQFITEPIVTLNWLDLPTGRFTARLASVRTTYMMSARMFVAALIQYNSVPNAVGTNVRFRWEYRPGSDFYAVYNDNRDSLVHGFPALLNHSFTVKFTRLLQM